MDRFIDLMNSNSRMYYTDLKSNMDRFIEIAVEMSINMLLYLKSNMDRFIGRCPRPTRERVPI